MMACVQLRMCCDYMCIDKLRLCPSSNLHKLLARYPSDNGKCKNVELWSCRRCGCDHPNSSVVLLYVLSGSTWHSWDLRNTVHGFCGKHPKSRSLHPWPIEHRCSGKHDYSHGNCLALLWLWMNQQVCILVFAGKLLWPYHTVFAGSVLSVVRSRYFRVFCHWSRVCTSWPIRCWDDETSWHLANPKTWFRKGSLETRCRGWYWIDDYVLHLCSSEGCVVADSGNSLGIDEVIDLVEGEEDDENGSDDGNESSSVRAFWKIFGNLLEDVQFPYLLIEAHFN